MVYDERNKSKRKGIKGILYNFVFSWQGLVYAYKHEKSMWIHAVLSLITVTLPYYLWLQLS